MPIFRSSLTFLPQANIFIQDLKIRSAMYIFIKLSSVYSGLIDTVPLAQPQYTDGDYTVLPDPTGHHRMWSAETGLPVGGIWC